MTPINAISDAAMARELDELYGAQGWHDADECDDYECEKVHRHPVNERGHHSNCHCHDCCEEDAE